MIEHIKEIIPFVAVIVASIAGWWAWRTSLLKALSDRVVHLEGKVDQLATAYGVSQASEAVLRAELTIERGRREDAERRERDAERREREWQARWEARRGRQNSNPGVAEDSEADALDDLAAERSDSSGLIAIPPGGVPK